MSIFDTLLTMVVSFIATVAVMSLCLCVLYCTRTAIQLADGVPGAFDDSEEFRKREGAALELMNDESRNSYLAAKRWIAANPPNSVASDISLSQYMAIQEKAVRAWEFESDITLQAAAVQNRTELVFYEGVTSLQTNLPLPKQNEVYYWETKIFEVAPHTTIGIGLATKPYPHFRLPGMHMYSVAYDSTGHRRLNQPFEGKPYGRRWQKGDVIGVGYRTYSGTVFFTHNGRKLEDVVQGMRLNLFPTIGSTGPATLVTNLGQAGFVYIEGQVKKWGLAPAQGSLAPPPAYGDQQDSVLLELETPPSPPRVPPPFDDDGEMDSAIGMNRLPPPYPPGTRPGRKSRRASPTSRTASIGPPRRTSPRGATERTAHSDYLLNALREAQQDEY